MVLFIRIQYIGKEKQILFFLLVDILDNEWIGISFQERLSSLESYIEQLETADTYSRKMTAKQPSIIITQATSSDRSINMANEEYEQLYESIQMLVK